MTSTAARSLRTGLGALAVCLVVAGSLTGCSGGNPSGAGTPSATATESASPSGTGSATVSGDTSAPSAESATPTTTSDSGAPSTGGTASATPLGPVTCNQVEPSKLGKITVDPKRTTDVATVVSDGRNVTSGTSEQTDFLSAKLVGPDGTVVSDAPTMTRVATMIQDSSKNTVLLTRPDSPDAHADVTKRPFSSPGTYALFNASSPLRAEVVVVCGGQQQVWIFTAEGNPTTGVVNCAVAPSRSNVVASLVYQNVC